MKDWVEIMRRELQAEGVRVDTLVTDSDVSHAFWNIVQRRIPVVPRTVHLAREFVGPQEHGAALATLKEKLERGDDVNRYRSSAVLDPEHKAFDDRLFNDWGVQHLHLGPENPDRKLSGRTGYCLYVYFINKDAYFLDVMKHGQYEKQELMLRMHRNWPEVIAEHRAPGVVFVAQEDRWDDASVKKLRGVGLSYMLTLDGVAYVAPGGGYMKSGNSFMAMRRSDTAFNTLMGWQERLKAEADDMVREMKEHGLTPGHPPTFRLVVRNDWFCAAREHTARTQIDMGYLLGGPPR